MTRNLSVWNTLRPFSVGFDSIFDEFDRMLESSEFNSNYPPYNIIQDGEKYVFELAVAGFTDEDISIIHEPEHGRLIVEGSNENVDATYLHKGIGGRKFKRVLNVSDTIVVDSASLNTNLSVLVHLFYDRNRISTLTNIEILY